MNEQQQHSNFRNCYICLLFAMFFIAFGFIVVNGEGFGNVPPGVISIIAGILFLIGAGIMFSGQNK